MKVVDPGRAYELTAGNRLSFLQKERGQTIRDGTTIEEVLEVLIDRVTDGYQRLPCEESIRIVYYLRAALAASRERTARRISAQVEGTHQPHNHRAGRSDNSSGGPAFDFSQLDLAPN